MKKKFAMGCLLVVCIVLLNGCALLQPFASTPEKTVYGFVNAVNKKDFNKALKYIEPSQSKGITAMLSLSGGFLGFDLNALLDTMPLLEIVAREDGESFELEYEITNVEISEDEAWVTGIEHITGEELSFYLVLEDYEWYISIEELF